MKKAIIIGASSGIGKELAKILSGRGYILGLAARRFPLLAEVQSELPERSYIKRLDIAEPVEAMQLLTGLIEEMQGADIVVICSAVCFYNPEINWQHEYTTVTTNVTGVTAMLNVAFNYFRQHGGGHIVGISSFKTLRGGSKSPAYNASKAFMSNYLEGLRFNAKKSHLNISVTDIRPGLVNTSMSLNKSSLFVISVETAAMQICKAIENKKQVAYIPMRYWLIAFLMQKMPFGLYRRL
jgi:short-subunit dehydrogenase